MSLTKRGLLAAALTGALVLAPQPIAVQAKTPVPLQYGRPEAVGMSTQRLAKITAAFNQEITEKKLPGAVVMVARAKIQTITSVVDLQLEETQQYIGYLVLQQILSESRAARILLGQPPE